MDGRDQILSLHPSEVVQILMHTHQSHSNTTATDQLYTVCMYFLKNEHLITQNKLNKEKQRV